MLTVCIFSVLFGIVIGLVGLLAAYIARKRPTMKLFKKTVQTERVMDVLFLLFVFVAVFLRAFLLAGDWQRVLWKAIVATVCALIPAVLIIWLGYRLILQKRVPVAEDPEDMDKA
ncbi:MAG: hypothetical protein J5586_06845 [Clostridia bacterium]|nr:hypothetical protein [Clostridia bacterium]